MPRPLELGTLKRRERRAPVTHIACHPITRTSIEARAHPAIGQGDQWFSPAPPPATVVRKSRKPLTHGFSGFRLIWLADGSQSRMMKTESQKISEAEKPNQRCLKMRLLKRCGRFCRPGGTGFVCWAEFPAMNGWAISGLSLPGQRVCHRGLKIFGGFGFRRGARSDSPYQRALRTITNHDNYETKSNGQRAALTETTLQGRPTRGRATRAPSESE